jgi:acetyl-CoA carboxylase, biotin carboxylase subunit
MTIDTVLIANRGEIALRILRTCRELGIRTVAAYSAADAGSPVVRAADGAVCIGPAAAKRSYLNIPALIEAARLAGADAIHPGYGFLSEDPDFAEVCEAEGLRFVGPPATLLALLGDKSSARMAMAKAGLPLLPGTLHPVHTVTEAEKAAAEVGYPLIIKAVVGGGGRGMQVVAGPAELSDALAQTRASALNLFGDGRVYLERYLPSARHVEVQVLADDHGCVISLGARDCTVQRRRQKLIEETPPPNLAETDVERITRDAVRGAQEVGYVSAGTFEFIVDDAGHHYFMEVNCRIQVEHPVTEMVTGVDIVAEQFRISAGQPLSMRQEDVAPRGAAMECRVNAEDPDRDFAPAPGVLSEFWLPAGPFVRVDTHAEPGHRPAVAYDSLLAKVIVWAPTRTAAIGRMQRALRECRLRGAGLRTTIGFLRRVLDDDRFRNARHRTNLVEEISATSLIDYVNDQL